MLTVEDIEIGSTWRARATGTFGCVVDIVGGNIELCAHGSARWVSVESLLKHWELVDAPT